MIKKKQLIRYGSVFLIGAAMISLILALTGFAPLGDKSILINDLNIQYVEYMKYLHTVVTGQNDFRYALTAGMGTGFIPIFSYYLSSPLQLLFAFISNDHIQIAVLIMTIIKIAASAVTMMIFLDDRWGCRQIHWLFALCYGLSAFSLAYSQCVMWLDGVIWLPVLIMGVEHILKGKTARLFLLAVFITVLSNYYTGIMALMFSVIYYCFRYFEIDRPVISFIQGMMKGIYGMFFGLLCNCWFLLPSFLSVINNRLMQKSETLPLFSGERLAGLNSFFPFVPSVTLGVEVTFDYAGLICFILVIASFFIKNRSNRKKLISSLWILFFILSVYLTPLYKIWHFMSMPYGFPSRFSFVLIFWLVSTAADCWDEVDRRSIVLASLLTALMVMLNRQMMQPMKFIVLAMILVIAMLFCFSWKKMLIIYGCAELVCSGIYSLITLDTMNVYDGYASYRETLDYHKEMEKVLDSFEAVPGYRIENSSSLNQNEGMGYNYPGISHYSSTYDKKVSDFLEHYGVTHRMFGSRYHGTTLFMDSFLGIRYLIKEKSDYSAPSQSDHYIPVAETDKYVVLENPYALPIAFLREDRPSGQVPETYSALNQNELANLFGSEPLLQKVPLDGQFVWDGDVLSENPLVIKKRKDQDSAVAAYVYPVDPDDPLYLAVPYDTDETWYRLWVNQQYLQDEHTGFDAGTFYLGRYSTDEALLIKLSIRDQLLRLKEMEVTSFDISALQQWAEQMKEKSITDIEIRHSDITMRVNSGNHEKLMTTIPYDKGWNVTVDGLKIEPEVFKNTFIEVPLKPGNHEIHFQFVPRGYRLGAAVSAAGLIAVAALEMINRKRLMKI